MGSILMQLSNFWTTHARQLHARQLDNFPTSPLLA